MVCTCPSSWRRGGLPAGTPGARGGPPLKQLLQPSDWNWPSANGADHLPHQASLQHSRWLCFQHLRLRHQRYPCQVWHPEDPGGLRTSRHHRASDRGRPMPPAPCPRLCRNPVRNRRELAAMATPARAACGSPPCGGSCCSRRSPALRGSVLSSRPRTRGGGKCLVAAMPPNLDVLQKLQGPSPQSCLCWRPSEIRKRSSPRRRRAPRLRHRS
mmetsp:Transcript_46294/g.86771  ORF Transcript_46294/g.86771 Transcript_46294/m.86771 type:complete len:213 (-) Transcript_46294:687-1325(-)